jgi:hypothetical protein
MAMRALALTAMLAFAASGCNRGPVPMTPEGREIFDVDCNFGISRCEQKAAANCQPEDYHIVSFQRTTAAFGRPYYYAKAACGPGPEAPGTNRYIAQEEARKRGEASPSEAASSAASAAPAPAAATAPNGCAKDTDCKGDRVCDHGECISPPVPAPPPGKKLPK